MSCILDFLLYDVTQREINNNNGGLRVQLPTLPISKSSGWRLVLSKGATFYLKPIIFWIYNTCYLVLFCKMMGKSMSLTMQELSKRSETLCKVWAITSRLYIEIHWTDYRLALWLRLASPSWRYWATICVTLTPRSTSKFREFMSPAIIVHLKMTKFKLQKKWQKIISG